MRVGSRVRGKLGDLTLSEGLHIIVLDGKLGPLGLLEQANELVPGDLVATDVRSLFPLVQRHRCGDELGGIPRMGKGDGDVPRGGDRCGVVRRVDKDRQGVEVGVDVGSDKVVGEETGRDVGVLERCRVELGHQLELAVGDGEVGSDPVHSEKEASTMSMPNSIAMDSLFGVLDTPGRRDEPLGDRGLIRSFDQVELGRIVTSGVEGRDDRVDLVLLQDFDQSSDIVVVDSDGSRLISGRFGRLCK